MHKAASRGRTRAALDFFRWSLEKGSSTATRARLRAAADVLVEQVKGYWTRTFNAGP